MRTLLLAIQRDHQGKWSNICIDYWHHQHGVPPPPPLLYLEGAKNVTMKHINRQIERQSQN